MLRVEPDGNLKIYTFNENVDRGTWVNTFKLVDGDDHESLCNLPRKWFDGVEWSKSCAPPLLSPCKGGGANVGYYKAWVLSISLTNIQKKMAS